MYKDFLINCIVLDVCGFADLTGDFHARDKVKPIAIKRLESMTEDDIKLMIDVPFQILHFAEGLLNELGLSIER